MSGIRNVLFLCAGDSARGLMAEAILSREGAGRFHAFSAGMAPEQQINPAVAALLRKLNHATVTLRPKGLDEFLSADRPAMDFVFTVSDSLDEMEWPNLPGSPLCAHWGVPNPVIEGATEAEKGLAVADTYRMLANRIGIFVNLPMIALDRLSLQRRLNEIGLARG